MAWQILQSCIGLTVEIRCLQQPVWSLGLHSSHEVSKPWNIVMRSLRKLRRRLVNCNCFMLCISQLRGTTIESKRRNIGVLVGEEVNGLIVLSLFPPSVASAHSIFAPRNRFIQDCHFYEGQQMAAIIVLMKTYDIPNLPTSNPHGLIRPGHYWEKYRKEAEYRLFSFWCQILIKCWPLQASECNSFFVYP